ncbi:MAG TPA: A24 family peptidase [Caulobacteraceae bacterium]
MIAWPFLVLQAAAGLCAGSFVTTAALRAARHEPYLGGRSHCDACGVTLGFAATAPVVAFVARRGACSACGEAIDPTHLVGEVLGAALLTAPFVLAGPARGGLIAAMGLVLLAAAVFDLKTRRLPDRLTGTVAVLAALLASTHGLMSLAEGVAAAGVTAVLLLGLRFGYARWRGRSGLGLGDVKLLCALALWLGVATPWALVVAALLGLIAVALRPPRGGLIAFGPFIALGALSLGLLKEATAWPLLP